MPPIKPPKTKSEIFIEKRSVAPTLSPKAIGSVSQYRKETLQEQFEKGEFRGQGYDGKVHDTDLTVMGNVIKSSTPFYKSATDTATSGSGFNYRGSGGTVRQIPEIYSPLWLTSNLNLPRDRATINAWCRAFFALNPVVNNAITLHSTYPISKMSIKCHNKKVEDFIGEMCEDIELANICIQVAQEFWCIGESIVFGQLDERAGKWSRLLIQNPDYIQILSSPIAGEPIISLRPDENLRKIVGGNRVVDVEQRKMLDPAVVEHVRKGENIPLDNFYVSHIARKLNPQDVRGTGLITSCFRQLMLFDLMYESKFAQAYNMINPMTLVKVGSDNYKATQADLEAYRTEFENAQYDRDFKLFCPGDVTVERIGYNAGIIDIANDITQLLKLIYTGLMVPSLLMDGGSDVTYANGGVTLDVLRQRYMYFRNVLTYWLRKRIFAPICKIQEFYEYEDGKKKLIVPEVEWNHMSLFDTTDYINILKELIAKKDDGTKELSTQTLYRSLGLDWKDEIRKKKEEAIQSAIETREFKALGEKSLNDLKALDADGDITEEEGAAEAPLPGQEGEAPALPGMPDLGGGMPGGGPAPGGMGGGPGGLPEPGGAPGGGAGGAPTPPAPAP